MTLRPILYRAGYKYQLADEYQVGVSICPPGFIQTQWINLDLSGGLTIKRGYAWDGPSGPTIDTKSFMRPSLAHDALYQLMRIGALDRRWREEADCELHRMCLEDGMSRLRAWLVYHAVRRFADYAVEPAGKKPVLVAPRPIT